MANVPLLAPTTVEDLEDELGGAGFNRDEKRTARGYCWRFRSVKGFGGRRLSFSGARRLTAAVTPSFTHRLIFSPRSTQTLSPDVPERVSETAYLDGLRGIASLVVYVSHLAGFVTKGMLYGYGVTVPRNNPVYDKADARENWNFYQLPIIRFFFNASAMVSLFFIISGYALSVAPLRHMRGPEDGKVLRSLSSSVLRRPIRLYLPTWIACLLPFVMLQLGVYEVSKQIHKEMRLPTSKHFATPARRASFRLEINDFVWWCWRLVSMCGSVVPHRLNEPTWTIPFEFEASIFLYLTHLGLSRLRPRPRMLVVAGLVLIAMLSDMWTMILFWAGLLLAEWNMSTSELERARGVPLYASKLWKLLFWLFLLIGVYLGSYPFYLGSFTKGFIWISRAIPRNVTWRNRFVEAIGAIFLLTGISRLQIVKDWLSGPRIRYLGHISFGLYLTHSPIVQTFGVRVLAFMYTIFDVKQDATCFMGFLVSLAITSVPVFWVADLFTRYVDVPCTKLGKTIEAVISKNT